MLGMPSTNELGRRAAITSLAAGAAALALGPDRLRALTTTAALGVVMASAGYPMDPRKGDVIRGLPRETPEAMVFHAGTAAKDGGTVTSGGRVLCVTALADTVKAAQAHAYDVLRHIEFAGAQYRRDIGHRAVKS